MDRRAALIEQYRQLHRLHRIGTVCDYGRGRSRIGGGLVRLNDATALRHDPAIPEHAAPVDRPCDPVICTDVMEHVPEDDVETVPADMRRIPGAAFFNTSLRTATNHLPSGGNAHYTVRPREWWEDRLHPLFPGLKQVRSIADSSVGYITF